MKVIYLKYTHGTRHSIIKEGDTIIINDSKIIPFNSSKKIRNKSVLTLNPKKGSLTSTCTDKVNEEITNFFFDAIHKNYLSTRNK